MEKTGNDLTANQRPLSFFTILDFYIYFLFFFRFFSIRTDPQGPTHQDQFTGPFDRSQAGRVEPAETLNLDREIKLSLNENLERENNKENFYITAGDFLILQIFEF